MTPRILTGHTITMVKVAGGGEVPVRRGEPLPEDLAEGEVDRLDRIGAFDPAPLPNLAGQGAARVPGTETAPTPGAETSAEAEAQLRAQIEAEVQARFAEEAEREQAERAAVEEAQRDAAGAKKPGQK